MSEFVCGLYEPFGSLPSERGIGVLRDFHVDGRVLKSLIIEKRQRGYAWYPLRRSVFFAACSHHLCHEITHLFGGALLHLPRDVGVGSQCESRVEMTEHAGHRFYVYAVLQC